LSGFLSGQEEDEPNPEELQKPGRSKWGRAAPSSWPQSFIARGETVVLKINGVTMCEVTDQDPRRTPAGYLALQVHTGPPMTVQFRNIRLKEFWIPDYAWSDCICGSAGSGMTWAAWPRWLVYIFE
jgi:hypothetical protein